VPETPLPDAETLRLIRETVAPQIADPYPKFARRLWNVAAAA
jgi:glutaconate CoA-transferase subunit B